MVRLKLLKPVKSGQTKIINTSQVRLKIVNTGQVRLKLLKPIKSVQTKIVNTNQVRLKLLILIRSD